MRAGVTQQELAAKLAVHQKTVSRWERDKQPPEGSALERVAQVLGVSVPWLRYGREGVSERLQTFAGAVPAPESFSHRHRAFVNRFLAELSDAGVTEGEESWARRVLMSPDNYGFNAGGNTPSESDEAMLRDIEGMSIGVRHILRARGYTTLPLRGSEP